MDGNGRWAERQGMSRLKGHRAGVENIRTIVKFLQNKGVPYVTLYAFSTENWHRPIEEVTGIFHILEEVMDKEAAELHRNNVRIRHVGSLEHISKKLQKSIQRAVELTKNNTGLTLGVALNYGGRAEIIDAVRGIVKDGVKPEDITEELLGRYLYAPDFPDVDLLIRTGGEYRTSNLMLWQTTYSELFFTPVLWPDFGDEELEKALVFFSQRQRRFGGLREK